MNKLKYLYYMYYRPKIFFSRKSYSMYGEDLIINNFFKKKKKGFYVDVGCYHPIDGSNTHLLFRRGWEGINIDVNSLSIDLFKAARKNDKNVNGGNVFLQNKEQTAEKKPVVLPRLSALPE